MNEQSKRIETLEENLRIALGRINALHAVVHTLVRTLGKPTEVIRDHLIDAAQKVDSSALASPLPDQLVDEMRRVLAEISWASSLAVDELHQTPTQTHPGQ